MRQAQGAAPSYDSPQHLILPMTALRQRLPRFAALVLLVWLFATGVAFAHTCQSTIDLECEDCCMEMKAANAWTETRVLTAAAAQPTLPPPLVTAVLRALWEPAVERTAPRPGEADPGGGSQPIPIVFLRLAL